MITSTEFQEAVRKVYKDLGLDGDPCFEEDSYGQVIIYTGLIEDESEIRVMTDEDIKAAEEEEEED